MPKFGFNYKLINILVFHPGLCHLILSFLDRRQSQAIVQQQLSLSYISPARILQSSLFSPCLFPTPTQSRTSNRPMASFPILPRQMLCGISSSEFIFARILPVLYASLPSIPQTVISGTLWKYLRKWPPILRTSPLKLTQPTRTCLISYGSIGYYAV